MACASLRGHALGVSGWGDRPVVAAIVFTDVVGSTARDRRLGPLRAEELRRSLLRTTTEIVDRHGGRLVKSTGDGFLSTFGTPSSAVDAAVAFQQAAAEAGRGRPDPVELRVGIAVGEVTTDERGDCFGLPVVEAARLCDAAQAGEIIVSHLVRRLCQSSAHPLRDVGSLALKGFNVPVEASVVEWRPVVTGGRLSMADIDRDAAMRGRAPEMLDRIGSDRHMERVRSRMLALLRLEPDARVLDVGCGAGSDVILLAELVGPSGFAVGIDKSAAMIEEARRRAANSTLGNIDFMQGDAASLEFEDGTFDATRSDRVLQYVLEGQAAVDELVRVTRPGGRVVVADTDWETSVFDSTDEELTSRINAAWTATRPDGRAGQRLYRYAKRSGLQDVTVEGIVQVKTDLDDLYREVLAAVSSAAVDSNVVTPSEASRWIASQEAAATEGVFFRAFTTFVMAGQVPAD